MRKLQASFAGLLCLFSMVMTSCQKDMDSLTPERDNDLSGETSSQMSINAVATRSIKVNIFGGANPYNNAEWNNWNTSSSLSSSAFKYSDGSSSTVTASLNSQTAVSDNSTSYTTTMAPKEVGRYTSYSTSNRTITISGLDNSKVYDLEVYASRKGVSNNTTRFSVGTQTVDIITDNNLANAATFGSLVPSNGNITLNLVKLKTYNYINGFILTESGDGTGSGSGSGETENPSETNPPAGGATNLVRVNVFNGTLPYNNAEWNNWNTKTSLSSSAFKYTTGATSTIKAVLSAQTSMADNGGTFVTTTPVKEVGRHSSYSKTNRTLTISGLDNSKTYDIELYAARIGVSNNTTKFTVGSTSIDIKTDNNLNKTANFSSLTPSGGQIVVTLAKLTTYNYLNGFTITEYGTGGGSTGNTAPSANAGTDKSITLPANSVQLTGSGTDADGTVSSYAWAKTGGPSQFTLSNSSIANPTVSNLVEGTYTFRLTVTDNSGATDTDNVTVTVSAQATGGGGAFKTHTLVFDASNNAYFPNAAGLTWKPGDTVNIPAGNYGLIDLGNIKGTAANPIIIRNKGGLVTVREIRFNNKMENFKLLGNGTPGITYGIKVLNAPNIAIAAAMVSNMEIAYVEVSGAGVGIMVKKNPVAGDASTQYPNYTIKDIKIHHNYIHDILTEGMYIGSTMPAGNATTGVPIRLQNVEIAFNTLERIGWDGIQMSTTLGTNSIHDNVVRNFGTVNYSSQQTGIAIGGAATGDIYNNTIVNGTGWGINAMGFGTIKITNNTVESVGANGIDKGAESIFADDRITGPESFPKQQMIITGNIIKFPQPDGAIRVGAYNNNSLPATVSNNTVYLPNAASNWLTFYVVSNALGSLLSGNTVVR